MRPPVDIHEEVHNGQSYFVEVNLRGEDYSYSVFVGSQWVYSEDDFETKERAMAAAKEFIRKHSG